MRAAGALVLLLAGGVAMAAAQESRHEEVIKQTLALLERANTTLATIQDRDTAAAARPELRKVAADWQELQKKAREVPPPERAEKDRLTKEYKQKLVEAERKLRGETIRLESIPGGRAALQEITSVLRKPES